MAAILLLDPARPVQAQEPAPSPEPTPSPVPREQDELDFGGRSSVLVGSGARALGMGGAFLARADDATAASWNPAGLSYLRRPEISLVGVRGSLDNEARTADGTVFRTDHIRGDAPDFLSAAYPVTLGSVSGAIQLSFQRVISFTGKRTIDETGKAPKRVQGEGGFDVLALGTGLRLASGLRAGVTFNRWFNGFHQNRERLQRRRTLQEVDFELSGFSVNAGIIWAPWENLNLGAVAKTPMHGKVRLARVRADIFSSEAPEEPDTVTRNEHASDDVRVDLPWAAGVGLSWRPSSPLTLSVDYTRTFWSDARIRNYFTLARTELSSTPPPPDLFPSLLYPNIFDTVQKDTGELRIGVEYVIIRDRLKLPLRAGYFGETQSFRAANDEAPRYDGFTAGLGILAGPFLFDIAYLYESGNYSGPTEDSGRVAVKIQRVLLSMIYRHGSGP